MTFIIVKYLLTAAIIVLVSEVAKRMDKLGALILALPLMTVFVMIWLHIEKASTEKIANHAYYTFWYVIPTLPMFLLFPKLMHSGWNFWLCMLAAAVLTFACFLITIFIAKKFGVELW